MQQVSWGQALAWRLMRQYISEPSTELIATASRLLGLHAQVASTTELIAAIRTPSYVMGNIGAALWEHRTLVRTWGMRGTLHLFPADELPLFISAFAQRQWPRLSPSQQKAVGISSDDLRRMTAAIGEILPGVVLTRDELATEIERVVQAPGLAAAVRSGWGQIFKPAAAGGLLCSGPNRGHNVTFTHPRTWLPGAPWDAVPDQDTAMSMVIARFLDSYGPAIHSDFGRWWGTDPSSARRLFQRHADVMVEVDLEGTKAWLTPAGLESMSKVSADAVSGTYLLPGFDPYVIAPISHRVETIPDGYLDRVSRTAGWISPVVLIDGVVRGIWNHQVTNGRLIVTIEPFSSFDTAGARMVTEAARRYENVLDAELEIRWTSG